MKTNLERIREKEYEKVKGKVRFVVKNIISDYCVISEFGDLDETLHKIKLDLITMANHGGIMVVFVERKEV